MNKELTPLEALERLNVTFNFLIESNEFVNRDISIIEKALKDKEKQDKALEIIKENLKYGYVFIGYDKDNKPLFQFADTKFMKKERRI